MYYTLIVGSVDLEQNTTFPILEFKINSIPMYASVYTMQKIKFDRKINNLTLKHVL